MSQLFGQVIRHAPAANSGAPGARADGRIVFKNQHDSGGYRIRGTVTVIGTPAQRRVQLYVSRGSRLIAETWSDATTGAYAFDYVRNDVEYLAVALDHTGAYDPESRVGYAIELMP